MWSKFYSSLNLYSIAGSCRIFLLPFHFVSYKNSINFIMLIFIVYMCVSFDLHTVNWLWNFHKLVCFDAYNCICIVTWLLVSCVNDFMLLVMWLFILFKSDNATAASKWNGHFVFFIKDHVSDMFNLLMDGWMSQNQEICYEVWRK